MITAYPKRMFTNNQKDRNSQVEAANGTRIDTFGRQEVSFKIGDEIHKCVAVVADVTEPIIGCDVINREMLSLRWINGCCYLESRTGQKQKANL